MIEAAAARTFPQMGFPLPLASSGWMKSWIMGTSPQQDGAWSEGGRRFNKGTIT
jgi:hypothetical protein